MYSIRVFYSGEHFARHLHSAPDSQVALDKTHRLLEKHSDCEQVDVWCGDTKLFAFDHNGNRIDN